MKWRKTWKNTLTLIKAHYVEDKHAMYVAVTSIILVNTLYNWHTSTSSHTLNLRLNKQNIRMISMAMCEYHFYGQAYSVGCYVIFWSDYSLMMEIMTVSKKEIHSILIRLLKNISLLNTQSWNTCFLSSSNSHHH